MREKNSALREHTVLSLSYGRVVVKPAAKLHGLVPVSFESYQILKPGDIVIRPTDLQNDQTSLRVGAVQDRGIITSAYIGLRPRGISDRFAFLYLRALDHLKVFYGMGSGLRQNLDFSDFKRLPMPLPSQAEQELIVSYMIHAQERINRAIATKRRLLELLAEERKSVAGSILEAAGGRQVSLKHLLLALIDCEHKTAPFSEEGSKRVVRTTGVRAGELVLAGTYPTTDEAYAQWTRRGVPEPGDVIFTREAPAGEACVVPNGLEFALGQRTVLMKLRRDRLEPNFLVQQIYSGHARLFVELASQGSTVGHFNMSDIGSLPIPAIDVTEQRELVDRIDRATIQIDALASRAKAEIQLLLEFHNRLTADVVTGQVDVREIATNLPAPGLSAAFVPDLAALGEDDGDMVGDEMEEE